MADDWKNPTKLKLTNIGRAPAVVNTTTGQQVIRPGVTSEVEVQKATADLLKRQAESDRNPSPLQPTAMAQRTMKQRAEEEAERQKQEEERQKAIQAAEQQAQEENEKASQPKSDGK